MKERLLNGEIITYSNENHEICISYEKMGHEFYYDVWLNNDLVGFDKEFEPVEKKANQLIKKHKLVEQKP